MNSIRTFCALALAALRAGRASIARYQSEVSTSRAIFLICAVTFTLATKDAPAAVSRWVEAEYQRQYDSSPPRLYRIGFVTGNELNTRYNTFNHEQFSLYAFVRFQNGGTAILKSTSPVFVDVMSPRSFCDSFMIGGSLAFVQLNDRRQRRWTLTAYRDIINWIDPNAARECL